jgi:hypothetical protein
MSIPLFVPAIRRLVRLEVLAFCALLLSACDVRITIVEVKGRRATLGERRDIGGQAASSTP